MRLSSPRAGLGGVIIMPAVALIYVGVFGIFCIISLVTWQELKEKLDKVYEAGAMKAHEKVFKFANSIR